VIQGRVEVNALDHTDRLINLGIPLGGKFNKAISGCMGLWYVLEKRRLKATMPKYRDALL
jgi:hypothetical protein